MGEGRILDARSTLVQFRFERQAHGSNVTREIIWVNRNPRDAVGMDCGGPFFEIHESDIRGSHTDVGVVCLCMGQFLE